MWLAILSFLAPITVIGVLTEDGDEICEKGEQRWVNVVPQIGWTTAYGARAPGSLVGKVVKITGESAKPPPARQKITNDFTCPPMQARSDWVRSKSGVRYDRDLKAPRHHLAVDAIDPFGGLTLKHDAAADTVDVRLENPLDVAFADVTLVLHYEGCYGKPGKLETVRALGRIEPGKAIAVAGLPARRMQQQGRGAEHVLRHVQVVSAASPILDIDAHVAALGADLGCNTGKGRAGRKGR